MNCEGKPLLDDNSVQTHTTKTSTGSHSESAFDDEPCPPDDNAAYLQKELQDRVQNEPALFEWIQKAALDGMWYVSVHILRSFRYQCPAISINFSLSLSLPTRMHLHVLLNQVLGLGKCRT